MKKGSLCLLIFATMATAQRSEHESVVARLNADLMPLSLMTNSADNPDRRRLMAKFASDVNNLYPPGFVNRSLASALTSALAGKGLSDDKLTPLTDGLLATFGAALACKASSGELLKSSQFRASIEKNVLGSHDPWSQC